MQPKEKKESQQSTEKEKKTLCKYDPKLQSDDQCNKEDLR
jgi:hypothetical protein